MFTSGITKIFISSHGFKDLFEAMEDATTAGYEALEHNSLIYISFKGNWIVTPFTLQDFQD